jgi:phosphoserine phosphatase
MNTINHFTLESNNNIELNFDGGDLSSDSGLFLVNELINKLGFDEIIRSRFHTKDYAWFRLHSDYSNYMQVLFQIIAGYFADDRADDLATEPVFLACLGKDRLASQPTLSRFFNRMEESTLQQQNEILQEMRSVVYSIPGNEPENILFDLDTTLLNTYGDQEGSAWNHHYEADGYHPKLCFDGNTGELLRIELRNGTEYCSKDVAAFMQPLFDEYTSRYPSKKLLLRGDSGFATPELYEQCERHGCDYAIRLKINGTLLDKAFDMDRQVWDITKKDAISRVVLYSEFMYQANSWDKERRVVCKLEKPYDSFEHIFTFVVTTLEDTPEDVIKFYCKRGTMENYIKECKNGFDLSSVSSATKIVNSNRVMMHTIAYNIIIWLKMFALPSGMKSYTIDTIRLKLFKIACRVTTHSRKLVFKLCSNCPYQKEFWSVLKNISSLSPAVTIA